MVIPQLDKCCCGCSLRTGTKIIGWFSLVCGIILVIMMGVSLAVVFYVEDHPEDKTKGAVEIREHATAIKIVTGFLIVFHILTCVLAFILLLGAYQNKARLVLIWVVVSLTVELTGQVLSVAQALLTASSAAAFLFSFVYFFIDLYFILVVYSFYREIKNVSTYP